MRNKLLPLLIVAGVMGGAFLFLQEPKAPEVNESKGAHRPLFWEDTAFYDAVFNSRNAQLASSHVRGGIIPHHLLASSMIAQFFNRIPETQVDRVVLIGPNHYELGNTDIITSLYDWDTPTGIVSADLSSIHFILDKDYIGTDEVVAEREHSLSGIMPFIAHYFPHAKVVPVIVSMDTDIGTLEDLASSLYSLDDGQTLFVASVDFSHYLSHELATERDSVTLALLQEADIDNLVTLNSQYTDSPQSLVLLIHIMDKMGLSKLNVLDHTNSGIMTGDKLSEVTSYFSIAFEE